MLIDEDKDKVFESLLQSPELSPSELFNLAWEAYTKQQYDDAFTYAQQAKNGKFLQAYCLLGMLYEQGLGVNKDICMAYKVFLEGALMGDVACQFQTYIHLLAGVGVDQNQKEAYDWLVKAANNQHSVAMRELAKTLGASSKYDEAYSWFVKAADAGDDEAKAWLGFCYEKGYGVTRDIHRAKLIYNQEVSRGNELARKFYNDLLDAEKKTAEELRRLQEQQRRIEEEKRKKEEERRKSKSKGCLWILLLVALLVGGYQFWYKDYKRDKDAPRSYVYATNLFLRSSAVADVEYNRINTVPYGAELIIYSNENGWAYVKANGEKGYVSSDYLLGAADFHLLNGVWGNEDAKETVATAKCRLAVLDYLKKNNMQTGNSGWQLYAKQKEMKPNSVLYPRLNDGYDNFTEFAFILKDNQSGNRKLALYSFEENEAPVFRYAEDAPGKGDIKSITYNKWNRKYKVSYSDREPTYIPQDKVETPSEVPLEVAPEIPSVPSGTITVRSIAFANVDFNNNILSDFGQPLRTGIQYLTSMVYYRKQTDATETLTLQVKIINPNSVLIRGTSSPATCTFEQRVTISGKEGSFQMLGWGNNQGNQYPAGAYRYEIWQNGVERYFKIFTIED